MAWTDDADAIANDVVDLLSAGTVTLRRVTRGALNTTTGVRGSTTTDKALAAVRLRSRAFVDGSGIKTEEAVYVIKASAASPTPPDTDDRLIDGTREYTVARVERSVDERIYELFCRRKV